MPYCKTEAEVEGHVWTYSHVKIKGMSNILNIFFFLICIGQCPHLGWKYFLCQGKSAFELYHWLSEYSSWEMQKMSKCLHFLSAILLFLEQDVPNQDISGLCEMWKWSVKQLEIIYKQNKKQRHFCKALQFTSVQCVSFEKVKYNLACITMRAIVHSVSMPTKYLIISRWHNAACQYIKQRIGYNKKKVHKLHHSYTRNNTVHDNKQRWY